MATKRKPAAGKKGGTKPKQKQPVDRRFSLLFFALGLLFVALSVLPSEAAGWSWLRHNVLFGVFGISGWLVGPLCIYVGVCITREKPFAGVLAKGLLVLAAVSGLMLAFGDVNLEGATFAQVNQKLFESGAESVVGPGYISIVLGYTLLALGGPVVARILLVVILLASLMLFTQTTPGDVVQFFRGVTGRMEEWREERLANMPDEEEEYEPEEGAPAVYAEQEAAKALRATGGQRPRKGRAADIPLEGSRPALDIPMDDGPVQSEQGMGYQEPVDIPKGGTFGKKPLDELTQAEDDLVLLYGLDDPRAPLVRPAGERPMVYDYEREEEYGSNAQPEQDLLGRIDMPQPKQLFEDEKPGEAEGDRLAAMIQQAADKQVEKQEASAPEPTPAQGPRAYERPAIELFGKLPKVDNAGAQEEMHKTADLLVSTLDSFGVPTRILDVTRGPSVTRYEIQPQAGVKISRITNLADDIALNLAAAGVRIEAPIPGKAAVGIEVPNKNKSSVPLRSILESQAFAEAQTPVPIALGKDIAGDCVVADLSKMPHLLIAGSTGSGKSVCVNATIMSFLYKSSPEDLRMILIDPKVVELAEYNGIPHLLIPVVTEPRQAAKALGYAVSMMEQRYHLFAENGVRDIRSYNKLAARSRGEVDKMPHIAIIIDELADLMMAAGKDVENYICRIAQKARAAGMHLIVATQRPSVDVITGLIKANIPSRIAFAVSSQVDSRTILDGAGAEKLLGMGDMLFMPVGANKSQRVQGSFVTDSQISEVLRHVKKQNDSQYDDSVLEGMDKIQLSGAAAAGDDEESDGSLLQDETFVNAVEMALESGNISTSLLQRRLRLGYARAGRLVDEMERMHIISGPNGSKPREVLITRQQWQEMSMNAGD